jgi:hypothetical protein
MGLPGCGHKEFKRPPEPSAGTARDYSTTFAAACKDCKHILLSQPKGRREEEKRRTAKTVNESRRIGARVRLSAPGRLPRGFTEALRLNSADLSLAIRLRAPPRSPAGLTAELIAKRKPDDPSPGFDVTCRTVLAADCSAVFHYPQ